MQSAVAQNGCGPQNGRTKEWTDLVASAEHCYYCFDAILAHCDGKACPPPNFPDVFCSLFVTWKKSQGNNLALRGCIGTLEPRQIHSALKDYALTSAFRDQRFQPISQTEVPLLHCTVSLIYGFETSKSWMDWDIGLHGLVINFCDRHENCTRSATFLPEVPAAERWTKRQTIESLVRKSGYNGKVDEDFLSKIELTTYRSSPFSISYADYVANKGLAKSKR